LIPDETRFFLVLVADIFLNVFPIENGVVNFLKHEHYPSYKRKIITADTHQI
jgi:hypothetical protein